MPLHRGLFSMVAIRILLTYKFISRHRLAVSSPPPIKIAEGEGKGRSRPIMGRADDDGGSGQVDGGS